jgi:hypothetical protein
MFEWLNLVIDQAQTNLETLFVIRAHPDEMRKGKQSQQGVVSWAEELKLDQHPNIYLIGPEETLSSYELIQRSKFCLVYNSSIGLEATLLGKPVLCAGQARYTQYPIVFYPANRAEYEKRLITFLQDESTLVPEDFLNNGRRFLFFQLYRASLPFEDFLVEGETPGYVRLKNFSWQKLKPGATPVIDVIVNGLLDGSEFILETEPS